MNQGLATISQSPGDDSPPPTQQLLTAKHRPQNERLQTAPTNPAVYPNSQRRTTFFTASATRIVSYTQKRAPQEGPMLPERSDSPGYLSFDEDFIRHAQTNKASGRKCFESGTSRPALY